MVVACVSVGELGREMKVCVCVLVFRWQTRGGALGVVDASTDVHPHTSTHTISPSVPSPPSPPSTGTPSNLHPHTYGHMNTHPHTRTHTQTLHIIKHRHTQISAALQYLIDRPPFHRDAVHGQQSVPDAHAGVIGISGVCGGVLVCVGGEGLCCVGISSYAYLMVVLLVFLWGALCCVEIVVCISVGGVGVLVWVGSAMLESGRGRVPCFLPTKSSNHTQVSDTRKHVYTHPSNADTTVMPSLKEPPPPPSTAAAATAAFFPSSPPSDDLEPTGPFVSPSSFPSFVSFSAGCATEGGEEDEASAAAGLLPLPPPTLLPAITSPTPP